VKNEDGRASPAQGKRTRQTGRRVRRPLTRGGVFLDTRGSRGLKKKKPIQSAPSELFSKKHFQEKKKKKRGG